MTNNKYKILLVEDDGSIRSIMTTMLESAGYQVIPADTCDWQRRCLRPICRM